MKPTIVEIEVFYTRDFSKNDIAETDEKIRAGYKKITASAKIWRSLKA